MNMLLVGIVLFAVLAVFCYNEARLERAMISDDLSRAVNFLQMEPFRDFREMLPPEGPFGDFRDDGLYDDDDVYDDDDLYAPDGGRVIPDDTLAVKISEDGTVTESYDNDSDLSAETLANAIAYAQANPSETLTENTEDGCFYISMAANGTTYMAFCDAENYHEEVRDTVIRSGILWLVIMALFFLISMFMARVAVRPVKESWDRQQEFVADASHELKTPLTVMLANNNILLSPERGLAEEDRKWVESNQEEAVHMKALVDQLLFLARSDSGDQKMLLTDIDLGDMIMADILQFEPVAFERGILIESALDPDIHIEGDSTMIRQLIHILLDNACKYAAENGTIHVALKKERQGCTLTVQNPGRPIPAEDLPHIFERFYRADKARTYQENASGYGLGLAIAKTIAEDHNGTISCTSNAEDGTTFTVRFRERIR